MKKLMITAALTLGLAVPAGAQDRLDAANMLTDPATRYAYLAATAYTLGEHCSHRHPVRAMRHWDGLISIGMREARALGVPDSELGVAAMVSEERWRRDVDDHQAAFACAQAERRLERLESGPRQ